MSTQNVTGHSAYRSHYGMAPRKLPKSLAVTLPFASGASQTLNLQKAIDEEKLEWVSTIYVDNSSNPSALSLTSRINNQTITVPALAQVYIPILAANALLDCVSTGGVNVIVHLLDSSYPFAIWFPAGDSGTGSLGADWSANQPAQDANLITTIPVNLGRDLVEVQNQDSVQAQVWLDNGSGSQLSVVLLESGGGANVGGGFWQSSTFKGRVRVYSTNASAQIMAREE